MNRPVQRWRAQHEKGGVKTYEAALQCVLNDDLRDEWEKYLDQTRTHVQVLQGVCQAIGVDPAKETPDAKSCAPWVQRS